MGGATPMISFVHIGDTHLFDGPQQDDRLAALDQIISEGSTIDRLGAWFCPGDLFHARSTIATRNALKDRITRMADLAPVVICYGNHDVDGDLDIFGNLSAEWDIIVVSTPQVVKVRLATEPQGERGPVASIFVLPWWTPTSAFDLAPLISEAGIQLEAGRRRGPAVMIGHVDLLGAVASTGQPSIGPQAALDPHLFDPLGQCYKGLNHIHKSQVVHGLDYAGSICRLSWGEIEPKTYNVVQYERSETGHFYYYKTDRVRIHVAPMYHVEGEFSRNGFSWHVTDGADGRLDAPTSWNGCDVRVRLRYKQSEGVVLAQAERDVKAVFAAARRFEFEPVCEPDRAVRAPAVALAKTLAEKIAAWADVAGVTLPADTVSKLGALEVHDAEQLIAEETARFEQLSAGDPAAEPALID